MLNDRPCSIVGVMPPGFEFFNRESDLIFPPQLPAQLDARPMASRGRNWRVMARLKSGLTLQEAQSRAAVISAGLADQYPEFSRGWTINLVPLPVDTAGPVRPALLMLMAAVGMVLLIACVNVGSLLLAQAGVRSKELAVRLALGATRWRVARQVLAESIILAVLGGAVGILLARLTVQLFSNLVPDRYTVRRFMLQLDQIRMDISVFAFAAVTAIGSAILFGILPAFRAANSDVNEQLKDTGRGTSSGRRARRGQDLLVVAQVMVAVVLVIGASLLAQSFRHLLERGPGFRPDHLKTVDLMLPGFQNRSRADYQSWVRTMYEQVMDRVAALAGIEAVTSVTISLSMAFTG
jgi:putative ABC transport system permease protein